MHDKLLHINFGRVHTDHRGANRVFPQTHVCRSCCAASLLSPFLTHIVSLLFEMLSELPKLLGTS